MTSSRTRRIFVRRFFGPAGNQVPGLTRDLPLTHEAPDQVRGGVLAKVNTTLTRNRNPLAMLSFLILTTVVTA
jgi:hypothetical protein